MTQQLESDLPDRLKLPMAFDAAGLAADLDALVEDDWIPHLVRQNYEGDWSVAPLRAPAGETHRLRMGFPNPGQTAFDDTVLLDRLPQIRAALRRFECPLRGARLMRLAPGAAILEHCDPDLDAAGGRARLHVPILTNDETTFLLNGRAVAMAPGETWYLRLLDPHAAANRGASDRIHLVVDVEIDEWMRGLLRAGR
ncbi:MAG TPA: aspartyl/asparaginyl beta-hydroxylase domain-containing protein [Allosphingosinicella sp.]|nr:aspartyl/asparaginyl beta-hydroxylase domain-containing protein [Allosphingosinicella sp.]